jgi:signal transduction histidine kinase
MLNLLNQVPDVAKRRENLVQRNNRHRDCQQGGWPGQPDTTNIVVAIDRLIVDSRADGGPEIEFYDDIPIGKLPWELQAVVFPVVQELLLNACRHSKSKNVLVGLGQDDDRICIQVQDWGIGFDPAMVQSHEHGLKAIRQLVQWQGGTVNVDSRPREGTCIVVEIPLFRETEPGDQMGDGQWWKKCEAGYEQATIQ